MIKFITLISLLFSMSVKANNNEIHLVSMVGENIISTAAQEFGATATQNGKNIYFTYSDSGYTHMTIMQSAWQSNTWSLPIVVPFSGKWNDADPSLTPDGKRIYFISNRPVNGKNTGFLEIWYTQRQGDSWEQPKVVKALVKDKGFKTYPSIANDGTLYFSVKGQVYLSRFKNGKHLPREKVGIKSSSVSISPDQRFMVLHHSVEGQKKSNLAISYFKQGKWSDPMQLPSPINSSASESSPNISSDGNTLYFTSSRRNWSAVKWPRSTRLNTLEEAKNEINNTWDNGLRNIYKVILSENLISQK